MSTFWRATITFFNSNTSLRSQNVLWFEDPSNIVTPASIAATIDSEWWGPSGSNRLRAMSSFHVKNESYTLQKVSPSPPGGGIPIVASGITGAVGTGVVYPTVGLCFTTLDGGSGRRHRGRVYHSGTPSSFLLNGVAGPSAITAFNTMRDGWLNAFGPLPTTGLHWCIFHRDLSGDARWTRINDIRMSTFPKCQRRRNFNIGF
jgi:hypothetical protein